MYAIVICIHLVIIIIYYYYYKCKRISDFFRISRSQRACDFLNGRQVNFADLIAWSRS